MDPITGNGDRLPVSPPEASDPQPHAPHNIDRTFAQQGPNVVFYRAMLGTCGSAR